MSHAPFPGAGAAARRNGALADIGIALIVIAVAVAAILGSRSFPATPLPTDVGPARFPILYSIALIVLALILVTETVKSRRRLTVDEENTPAAPTHRPAYGKVVIGVALTIASIPAMDYVGYAPTTAVYLSALMALMGQRGKLLNPLIAVALTAAIYFAFSMGLQVPLPGGSLFE